MSRTVAVARISRGHLEYRGGRWWACLYCDTMHPARSDGDEPDVGCQCADARAAWRREWAMSQKAIAAEEMESLRRAREGVR